MDSSDNGQCAGFFVALRRMFSEIEKIPPRSFIENKKDRGNKQVPCY
jgi:hypothetical protein